MHLVATVVMCTVLYTNNLVILSDTPAALQKLLDTLDYWCAHNGMVINPKKQKLYTLGTLF